MDALGRLAADEAVTYDKELDSLGNAVKGHKFTDAKEADAFALFQWFRDLFIELGNYRAKAWNNLSESQRQALEDAGWKLLNGANELTTAAVGLTLDESETSFDKLKESSERATEAVKTLKTVAKVVTVATAAVGLTAAILSKDSGAIGKNAKALYDAATSETA